MTHPVNNVPHPSCSDPGRSLLGVSSYHLSSGCSWPVVPAAWLRGGAGWESTGLGPHHQHRLLSKQKDRQKQDEGLKKMSLGRNRERSGLFEKMAGGTGIANLNNREAWNRFEPVL